MKGTSRVAGVVMGVIGLLSVGLGAFRLASGGEPAVVDTVIPIGIGLTWIGLGVMFYRRADKS